MHQNPRTDQAGVPKLLILAVVLTVLAAACGRDNQSVIPSGRIKLDAGPTIVVPRELDIIDIDSDGSEVVVVDASASADNDGGSLTFNWSQRLETVSTGPVLTETLPVGIHVFTLTVTDEAGSMDVNSVVIRVLATYVQDPGGPVIDLWGGYDMHIDSGAAQRWFDIPGNVSDPDGVAELRVSLNGGRLKELSMGPDGRRLVRTGDFNIDLPRGELLEGDNVVRIEAIDNFGAFSIASLRLTHDSVPPPALPIVIDWRTQPLDGLVEVVDGNWRVDGPRVTIEPDAAGYDRLLAIGDDGWTDYEVHYDFVVDKVNSTIGPFSNSPVIGLLLRWNGHNDSMAPRSQPKVGIRPDGRSPTPIGAFMAYVFLPDGSGAFQFQNHRAALVSQDDSVRVSVGTRYRVKARVETTGSGSTYTARIWPAGETEPTDWAVTYEAGNADLEPRSGSIVLLAHELAVSIGTVSVRPIP